MRVGLEAVISLWAYALGLRIHPGFPGRLGEVGREDGVSEMGCLAWRVGKVLGAGGLQRVLVRCVIVITWMVSYREVRDNSDLRGEREGEMGVLLYARHTTSSGDDASRGIDFASYIINV